MNAKCIDRMAKLKCFCFKCGFVTTKDIEVTEKTYSDGEKVVIPKNKNEILPCIECSKNSMVVFNMQNMGLAVEFLLKNMYQMKKANDSEAIKFLANVLDVSN